ncbi:hypothetical protein CYMTET_32305, partial [Cymbomonas tetramitiformis]
IVYGTDRSNAADHRAAATTPSGPWQCVDRGTKLEQLLRAMPQPSRQPEVLAQLCHHPDPIPEEVLEMVAWNCTALLRAHEADTLPACSKTLATGGQVDATRAQVLEVLDVPDSDSRVGLRGQKMAVASASLRAGDVLGCYGGTLTFGNELNEKVRHRSLHDQLQHESYIIDVEEFRWPDEIVQQFPFANEAKCALLPSLAFDYSTLLFGQHLSLCALWVARLAGDLWPASNPQHSLDRTAGREPLASI